MPGKIRRRGQPRISIGGEFLSRSGNERDLTGCRFGRLTVEWLHPERDRFGACRWLCRCDCGDVTVAPKRSLQQGTKSCGCLRRDTGEGCPNWRGGRSRTGDGYVKLKRPRHGNADRAGYIFEHTLVMSELIGRPLRKGETVHHKNGVRDDNHPDNLELWDRRQPAGARVADKIQWAKVFLAEHGYEVLKHG